MAISFGPVEVRWYGLIIALAVLIGYLVAYRRVKLAGQDPEHLTNILIYGLVSAIIGARLYYVAFSLPYYLDNPREIIAVWRGGIAIHGALIGAMLSTYIYTKRHRLVFWRWVDLLIPSMILGQAIGRWGNYMNQEAFGTPTELPWAIFIEPAKRPAEFANFSHFHPTFLYESVWNIFGFIFLLYMSRRQDKYPQKWPTGSIFLLYALYYSIGRGFIEGLRTDSLMLGPVRVAQLVSVMAIVASILVLWRWRTRAREAIAS